MAEQAKDHNITSTNHNLGQVWTPDDVAVRMCKLALHLYGSKPGMIVDPSCGPATFQRAFNDCAGKTKGMTCFELDKFFSGHTKKTLDKLGIPGQVREEDYLLALDMEGRADIVIMNPPYVRHEMIQKNSKDKYHRYITSHLKCSINKRSNLLVYFLLKAIIDLRPGGILCAVVYDAITQTQYGHSTLAILNQHAEQLYEEHIQTPFNDVLIDAKILVFRKRKHPNKIISLVDKIKKIPFGYSQLAELVDVKRGTGLISRSAFIAKTDDPFYSSTTPFFVKQQSLDGLVVHSTNQRAYIFSPEDDIKPGLEKWLSKRIIKLGKVNGNIYHRTIRWPIFFNYYIRSAPRHLLNQAQIAVSDNFYLVKPQNNFSVAAAWLLLNSDMFLQGIVDAGRTQGSGLTKVQLFEYKSAIVPDWRSLSVHDIASIVNKANRLISEGSDRKKVFSTANNIVKQYWKKI